MAKFQLTLPAEERMVDGKQITFKSPSVCNEVSSLVVDGVEYSLVDYKNNVLCESFEKDSIVSVIVDTVNRRACVQNIGTGSGGSSGSDHTHPLAKYVYNESQESAVSLVGITTVETEDDENGWKITDNTLSAVYNSLFTSGVTFHVNFQGNVKLEIEARSLGGSGYDPISDGLFIQIDGVELSPIKVESSNAYFEYSGVVNNEITLHGCYADLIFNTFSSLGSTTVYTSGFMSGQDKEKIDMLYADEKGNAAFGDFLSHSFYGSNNFTSGSGNKLGSKAYHIISFSGINDSTGYYYLDGTNEDAQAIQALLDAREVLGITIRNGHWLDNHCKIISVVYNDADKLCIEVDNFYTNMPYEIGGYTYDSNFAYSSKGHDPYNDFPELGYAVQNGTAYLFVVGHPEFGSFEMCRNAASVGRDNVSQNDFTFSSGWNNVSNGRYSGTIGNSNKAGYCTLATGVSNDGSKAHNSIIAGYYNTAMKHIECVTMLGKKLNGSYNNQVILGCYNNNKEENAVEIGGGNGNRLNVFEVKKNGALATNEKYYPGSEIGERNISMLTSDGNYGNVLKDSDIYNKNYVYVHNISAQPDSATTTTQSIYPVTTYYKPNNMPYFAYIRINADTLGTNNGLKLAIGKYILAYDMNIKSADNIEKTSVAGIYKPYDNIDIGTGAGKDKGFGGLLGKFKFGINHVYVPFELDYRHMQFGVYHTKSGDSGKTDGFEFEISNFRLYKLHELELPLSAERALTFSGNSYICVNSTLIDEVSNPAYIGYNSSGVEYIAACDKPDYATEKFYAVCLADFNFMNHVINKVKDHNHKLAGPDYVSLIGITSGSDSGITENSLSGLDTTYTIDHRGYVKLVISYSGTGTINESSASIFIDGVLKTKWAGPNADGVMDSFSFEGTVSDNIQVYVNNATVTFETFINGKGVRDGFMSGEDKLKLDTMETKIAELEATIEKIKDYIW